MFQTTNQSCLLANFESFPRSLPVVALFLSSLQRPASNRSRETGLSSIEVHVVGCHHGREAKVLQILAARRGYSGNGLEKKTSVGPWRFMEWIDQKCYGYIVYIINVYIYRIYIYVCTKIDR